MKNVHLVVTLIGPDRRGIVADVTEVINEHHASIKESRMTRLGGEFAIIMLVSVPSEQKELCAAALQKFDEEELTVSIRKTDLSRPEKFKGFVPYEVLVWGADLPGIVHTIAEYLTEEKVQVEDVETHVTQAPITGTPLFSMTAFVQAPPELTLPELREKLEDVGDELGVDIDVKLRMD